MRLALTVYCSPLALPMRPRLRRFKSTLFYGSRPAQVVSLEHHPQWFQLMRAKRPRNCTLIHEPPSDDYAGTTPLFLHRAWAFAPVQDRPPVPGIGPRPYNWESGAMRERLDAKWAHATTAQTT